MSKVIVVHSWKELKEIAQSEKYKWEVGDEIHFPEYKVFPNEAPHLVKWVCYGYDAMDNVKFDIKKENNSIDTFNEWLKNNDLLDVPFTDMIIEYDSYGSHDVFIGVRKNGVCYQYWNPSDEVIIYVKQKQNKK